jgi:AraC family transcriptional regulator of adaptative response / DNA-3-methyladenine glycosylase II
LAAAPDKGSALIGSEPPARDLLGVEVTLRLGFRQPLCPDNLFGHLAATAVPGVEEWLAGSYRRTVRLPHGPGVLSLRPDRDHVAARLTLTDARDEAVAVRIIRRLLDLDVDPEAVDGVLSGDPTLAPLIAAAPGRRVPGTVDAHELAVRAVLGQQVSTAAARTHASRLVLAHGERITDTAGGLTHLFPTAEALTTLDPAALALPMARRATLLGLVRALADGTVDVSDPALAGRQLGALPGIGPWTVETIAMRALGDADAFLPTDLGVRAAAARLGLPTSPGRLTQHAERWRPWRSYAVQHLWATGDHPVNRLPA